MWDVSRSPLQVRNYVLSDSLKNLVPRIEIRQNHELVEATFFELLQPLDDFTCRANYASGVDKF